jgi:hypothetical protein
MRTTVSILCAIAVASTAVMAAENAVILESFEESIDSVAHGTWGGSRIPDGVVFGHYTTTGPDDISVTHGNKSLQVDLYLAEWWVHDFMITLSEEASDEVRQAAQSGDVGRYILRYDIIFPGGTYWMNNQAFFGNINDQLNTPSSANGGKATMSWALDLVTGLAEEGQIILRFADNFDATDDPFFGPLTVYVDNFRLVDTYAAGATPVTTILQSFEDAADPTGSAADFTAWGGTPRSTYMQHTKADPDDIRVTHGTKSLQVHYASGGDWKADFTLPFAGTKLAEVLKLELPPEERPTPAELARYTLRYDIIYPDRNDDAEPQWAVTQQFAHNGSWLPFGQARRDGFLGQAQTVSITLDQIPNWDADVEGAPLMVFVAQGDFDATGEFTLYYDNFRLIDTGGESAARPRIESITVNAQGKVVVTWTGGGVLQRSPSLSAPQWNAVTGAASGSPIDPPSGHTAFYRIARQ